MKLDCYVCGAEVDGQTVAHDGSYLCSSCQQGENILTADELEAINRRFEEFGTDIGAVM
ncbi:MAG: hypothetical protein FWF59_09625 [Turicibacter sp.]|nr:hypothetical protein [Turicibacter sp.]